MPQRDVDALKLREIKLAHLRLVRDGKRLVQRPRIQSCFSNHSFQHLLRQNRVEVPNPNSLAIQLLQEIPDLILQERLLYRLLQPGELLRLLNFDGSLLGNSLSSSNLQTSFHPISGAGDGNRTRDQQLGRL